MGYGFILDDSITYLIQYRVFNKSTGAGMRKVHKSRGDKGYECFKCDDVYYYFDEIEVWQADEGGICRYCMRPNIRNKLRIFIKRCLKIMEGK